MQVRKREGESASSLIYRFSKRTQQSGILKEAKRRRFFARPTSKFKRHTSAISRSKKRAELLKAKKLGLV